MSNPFRKRWAVRVYYLDKPLNTEFRYWTRWGALASANWLERRLRPRVGVQVRMERLP